MFPLAFVGLVKTTRPGGCLDRLGAGHAIVTAADQKGLEGMVWSLRVGCFAFFLGLLLYFGPRLFSGEGHYGPVWNRLSILVRGGRPVRMVLFYLALDYM